MNAIFMQSLSEEKHSEPSQSEQRPEQTHHDNLKPLQRAIEFRKRQGLDTSRL
jgi:hypothetical protein